jgi:hypothetical protein
LPDGIFSDQKSHFGYILESLEKEKVGIFKFGNFVVFRNIFTRLGKLYHEKSGNPVAFSKVGEIFLSM